MTTNADRFEPLSPERAAEWTNFAAWDRTFFPTFVGLEVEELRLDYARMRLPFRPELEQLSGVVHGGAIATLIDTVVVPAIGTFYEERPRLLTIAMNVQYVGPVIGEDAIAEGWVEHRGRSTVFCRVEVRTASSALAAIATLIYRVSPRPPGGRA